MGRSRTALLLWISLPVALAILTGYLLHAHTTPVFSASVLRGVAEAARLRFPPDGTTDTLEKSVAFISAELHQLYPKHIHLGQTWTTNLAGGFKTGMLILHACGSHGHINNTMSDARVAATLAATVPVHGLVLPHYGPPYCHSTFHPHWTRGSHHPPTQCPCGRRHQNDGCVEGQDIAGGRDIYREPRA
jgi:hypothetical protein